MNSTKPSLKSIAIAMEKADEAFWSTLAANLPEIKTGDFGPDSHAAWWLAVRKATASWVTGNLPLEETEAEFSFNLWNKIMEVPVPYIDPEPAIEIPPLPEVGTIVRAKFSIAPIPGGWVWKKGWSGEVKTIDDEYVSVECHRYLGPDCHEWDNCRILSTDDGAFRYEEETGESSSNVTLSKELLSLALHQEFEVIG